MPGTASLQTLYFTLLLFSQMFSPLPLSLFIYIIVFVSVNGHILVNEDGVLRFLGPALIDPHYNQKASVTLQVRGLAQVVRRRSSCLVDFMFSFLCGGSSPPVNRHLFSLLSPFVLLLLLFFFFLLLFSSSQRNSTSVWTIASDREDQKGDVAKLAEDTLSFKNKENRQKLQLRQTGDIRVSGNRFVLAGAEFSSVELVSAALSDSSGGGQRLSFSARDAGSVWDLVSDAPSVAGFGEHDEPSPQVGTLQLLNAEGLPVLRIRQNGETMFGRSNLRVGSASSSASGASGELLFTVDASSARHGITYSLGGDSTSSSTSGGAPQLWRVQLNDASAPAGHEDHWSLRDAKDGVRLMVSQSAFEDAGDSLVDDTTLDTDDDDDGAASRNVGIVLDASTIVGDLPTHGPAAPAESLGSFTPRDLLVTGDLVVGVADPAATQSGNLRVRGEVSAGASVSTRGSLLIRNATSGDPAVTFQADDEGGLTFLLQATRATTVFRANGDVEVPGQVTATGLKVKPKLAAQGSASEAFLRLENSLEEDRTVFELANTATGRLTIRSREFVNGAPHGLPVPHLMVTGSGDIGLGLAGPVVVAFRQFLSFSERGLTCSIFYFPAPCCGLIFLGVGSLPGFVLQGSAGVAPRARVDVVGSRPRLWRMNKARKDAVQLARDGGYDYDPTLEPFKDGFSTGAR